MKDERPQEGMQERVVTVWEDLTAYSVNNR